MKLRERVTIAAIFVAQLTCLTIVASRNRHMLNPDGVAYLQVTRHLLRGDFGLSVNGYWGPLISWLAVPLLAGTHDPLLTARCSMVISAVVFLAGAFVYMLRSKLPFAAVCIGTAACGFVSIFWSVSAVTPDLLADGLLFLGFSGLSGAEWVRERPLQRWSGFFLGAAYLAKAIMLPVSIMMVLAISLHHTFRRRDAAADVIRAASRTIIFLAIIALPWISILTAHYRKPTFSTAGPIAHALVGPSDVDRRHPVILSFHRPRSGRVTDAEDPDATAFRNWSPFASRDYMHWQLKTIRENATKIQHYVDGLTSAHLGAIAMLLALLIAMLLPKRADDAPSLLAATPLLIAAGIYAPVFADSLRYYILAYPLMLGAAGAIGKAAAGRSRLLAILSTILVAVAIVVPARAEFRAAFTALSNRASSAAIDLARRMKRTGMTGSIAGVAPIDGGMGGLYTAFLLDVPWCGDEPQPRMSTLRASGARYWIIGTDDREKLKAIPAEATRDVTANLYGAGTASAPFIIREVIR